MPLFDTRSPETDPRLARYLLGLLSAEETDRLDEASIVDDDFAARLRTAEVDLVDAYVRGTLSDEMTRRFEAVYMTSPRRRQHVAFARKFLRAIERTIPAGDVTGASPTDGSKDASAKIAGPGADERVVRRLKVAPRFMAAAALLFVACGALALRDLRLRDDLAIAARTNDLLEQRARGLERALRDARSAHAGADDPRDGRAAVALVLAPQTRGIGPVPAVAVSPGTDHIDLELRLESNDFSSYFAALDDPASGATVWRTGPVAPVRSGAVTVVPVAVPSGALRQQHYSLVLTGPGRQVVASYTFGILRR